VPVSFCFDQDLAVVPALEVSIEHCHCIEPVDCMASARSVGGNGFKRKISISAPVSFWKISLAGMTFVFIEEEDCIRRNEFIQSVQTWNASSIRAGIQGVWIGPAGAKDTRQSVPAASRKSIREYQ